jgi:hypothetical protein
MPAYEFKGKVDSAAGIKKFSLDNFLGDTNYGKSQSFPSWYQ